MIARCCGLPLFIFFLLVQTHAWADTVDTDAASTADGLTLLNEEPNLDSRDRQWRLVKDKSGIQVYTSHSENSPMKTFRGVATITTDKPINIVGALNDYDYMPSWMHFVRSAEVLKMDDYENRLVRILCSVPWPLSPREAVANGRYYQNADTLAVYIAFENAPDVIPETEGYVRIPEFNGRYSFEWVGVTDDGRYRIEATYELIINPGGAIPPWLANLFMAEIPYYTLQRLIRLAQTDRYDGYIDPGGIHFPPAEDYGRLMQHGAAR